MNNMDEQMQQLKTLLKIHWNYSEFRFGQTQAITSILKKQNTVVIMPTGGGKSLIYQLPSLILPGITIVISPLIALMKDQVDQLEHMGIPATFINSSLSQMETQRRIIDIKNNIYKLVYIAPERFYSQEFVALIQNLPISLFAIDEAHCISEWGHDFRPSYMRLKNIIKLIGNPPVLAVTATATPEVREDIIKQLELDKPSIIVTGFDRPNLKFSVIRAAEAQKYMHIFDITQSIDGAGIIYAGTRQKVESILEYLLTNGIEAAAYHAGMEPYDRKTIQNDFMSGKTRIIVATNAFGLGINKSDIRFVIHFDMPGTIEAYYQEAGRAGRDGKDSHCVMLYSPSDRYLREFFIKGDNPPVTVITEIYNNLLRYDDDTVLATYNDLKDGISEDVPDMAIGTALKILERENYIHRNHEKNASAYIKFLQSADKITEHLSAKAKVQHQALAGFIKHFGDNLSNGVQFSPEDIADIANVKREAITRLMKKLEKDNLAEYHPPFRGTAINILKRVPAENLDINFTALKEKHHRELNKLDLMENYIYDYSCRRKYILDYFQDKAAQKCGICDNCLMQPTETESDDLSITDTNDINIIFETKLTEMQTYEYYQQGMSIDEIAQQRNLKPGTIVQHLCFLIDHDKNINIDKFVDKHVQNEIKKIVKKINSNSLNDIKKHVNDDISWDDIRLTLAKIKQNPANKH